MVWNGLFFGDREDGAGQRRVMSGCGVKGGADEEGDSPA